MSQKRDEMAEKRALRQCTTGQPDLDKAIQWYLTVGFEAGWDAAIQNDERVLALVKGLEAIENMESAIAPLTTSRDIKAVARQALTQYRESVKK